MKSDKTKYKKVDDKKAKDKKGGISIPRRETDCFPNDLNRKKPIIVKK